MVVCALKLFKAGSYSTEVLPPKGSLPYFHSFGVTPNYIVLPQQACTLRFGPLEKGLPMGETASGVPES